MRRPINWFVFCLSLAFLVANLSFDRRQAPAVVRAQSSTPTPTRVNLELAQVTTPSPDAVRFGYVLADGSFVPLTDAPVTSASRSWR